MSIESPNHGATRCRGGAFFISSNMKTRCKAHMRRIFRFLIGLGACGVLLFATINLAAYIRESNQSANLNEKLIDDAVLLKKPASQSSDTDAIYVQEMESDTEQIPHEAVPIEVDFDALLEKNEDIIGWPYSEDTPINLPVTQSTDNDYYLRRLIDGTWNSAGTLFVDYRNDGAFSDNNTIIYGHNMKNKEMFGTLPNYKERSYFEEHPIMWLLTPDRDYKIELVAGYVTPTTSDVYSFEQSEEDVLATVQQSIEKSTFSTDVEINHGERFLTLSTCSYEYDDARYVLIGRMIALK